MLRLSQVAPGNPGIYATIDMMRRLITDPSRRADALASLIRGDHQQSTTTLLAAAVHDWVIKHMTYTPDYHELPGLDEGVEEALHEPELLLATIENRGKARGDCDDYSILAASLLYRMNIPVDFVIASTAPDQEFNHVYLQVHTDSGVFAVDGIFGQPFGWSADQVFTAKQVIPL